MGKKAVYSIGGTVLVFALWFMLYLSVKNQVVVPSPFKTLKNAVKLLGEGYFYQAVFSTLLRVVIAFLISLIVAIITAVIAYIYKPFAEIFGVVVAFFRSLPTLAVMLIILVAVKRTTAPIIVCFLTLFPLLYTSIYSSLRGVSCDVLEMCKVYKVPVKKQVLCVYLPSSLPKFALDFTSAVSFGIKVTVSAEILASVYGSVGGLMSEASIYADTVTLFSMALILCLIGIIVEFIGKFTFDFVEKRRV